MYTLNLFAFFPSKPWVAISNIITEMSNYSDDIPSVEYSFGMPFNFQNNNFTRYFSFLDVLVQTENEYEID